MYTTHISALLFKGRFLYGHRLTAATTFSRTSDQSAGYRGRTKHRISCTPVRPTGGARIRWNFSRTQLQPYRTFEFLFRLLRSWHCPLKAWKCRHHRQCTWTRWWHHVTWSHQGPCSASTCTGTAPVQAHRKRAKVLINGSGQDKGLGSYHVHFHYSTGARIQKVNPGAKVRLKTCRGQHSLQETMVYPIKGLRLVQILLLFVLAGSRTLFLFCVFFQMVDWQSLLSTEGAQEKEPFKRTNGLKNVKPGEPSEKMTLKYVAGRSFFLFFF